jgi:hypothetical protein|tara:strand:+ start:1126 stop:1776 length:651 start_codon:yes stop_codon:yes gene_type:complete
MSTENRDTFSEVIDITLHKYNSIDLKLWGIISRYSTVKRLSDEAVLIGREELKNIVYNAFRSEISRFKAISDVAIHKEATSIYFIHQILETMSSLMWVKFTLNKNASYSRIVNIDQIKTIKYSTKTLRGSIRLFDIFNEHEADVAGMILRRANLLGQEEHFMVMRVRQFLSSLDLFLSENNTTEVFNICNAITQTIEHYESDNPEMLLIADKKSDI